MLLVGVDAHKPFFMSEKYPHLNFNIVLVEPEIPTNTGNIGRTCVGSYSHLHLVHPLGFEITDTRLKRAGLDYWGDLQVTHHKGYDQWFQTVPDPSRVFFFTTKVDRPYFSVDYKPGDYLVFGPETRGLSKSVLEANADLRVNGELRTRAPGIPGSPRRQPRYARRSDSVSRQEIPA